MRYWMWVLALMVLPACGLLPGPQPPTQPCEPGSCDRSNTEMCNVESGKCVPCVPDLSDAIWNTDAGDVTCSTSERPVKHYPETEECPVLTEPCKPPPPALPEPQCPRFTDRGGTERCQSDACDCYCVEEFVECEIDPGECVFHGDDEEGNNWRVYTPSQKPTHYYNEYRKALVAVGNTCGEHPMESLRAIARALNDQGICAKQEHDAVSILRNGAGEWYAEHPNVKPDGMYEEWHAIFFGGNPAGCSLDGPNAHKATWDYVADGVPPSGKCPEPHPDVTKMKFNTDEKDSHLDTTWTTVGQPEFCESIGYCCMPGTGPCDEPGCVPRAGCPVRGDGDPERAACEEALCDQRWECNGEPYPPYRGNPAQTDCRGHWQTFCANAPTVAEGDR